MTGVQTCALPILVAARIQQRLKEGLPVIACGDLNDTPISYTDVYKRQWQFSLLHCYIVTFLIFDNALTL